MADWKELSNKEFVNAVVRECNRRSTLCFLGIFTDASTERGDVIIAKDWPLPEDLRSLDEKPWELLRNIANYVERSSAAGLIAREKVKRET